MTLDGSRKTMNFIVLPCDAKKPLIYGIQYNLCFKNSSQKFNNLIILQKCTIFPKIHQFKLSKRYITRNSQVLTSLLQSQCK